MGSASDRGRLARRRAWRRAWLARRRGWARPQLSCATARCHDRALLRTALGRNCGDPRHDHGTTNQARISWRRSARTVKRRGTSEP